MGANIILDSHENVDSVEAQEFVLFSIGDDCVKADIHVLISSSPVFQAMLSSRMKERNQYEQSLAVHLDASSHHIQSFSLFLSFLAINDDEIIEELLDCAPPTILEITELSHRYLVDNLLLCCEQALLFCISRIFDTPNLERVWKLSQLCELELIQPLCLDRMTLLSTFSEEIQDIELMRVLVKELRSKFETTLAQNEAFKSEIRSLKSRISASTEDKIAAFEKVRAYPTCLDCKAKRHPDLFPVGDDGQRRFQCQECYISRNLVPTLRREREAFRAREKELLEEIARLKSQTS